MLRKRQRGMFSFIVYDFYSPFYVCILLINLKSFTEKASRLYWRFMLYSLKEEEWRGRVEKNGLIFFEFLESKPSKKLETCKGYQLIRTCGGQWGDLNASHQSSNNVKICCCDACGVAVKEMKTNKSLHVCAPKSLNIHFHHTPCSKNKEWFTFGSTPSLPLITHPRYILTDTSVTLTFITTYSVIYKVLVTYPLHSAHSLLFSKHICQIFLCKKNSD